MHKEQQEKETSSWISKVKPLMDLKKEADSVKNCIVFMFSADEEYFDIYIKLSGVYRVCGVYDEQREKQEQVLFKKCVETLISSHSLYPPTIKTLVLTDYREFFFRRLFSFIYDLVKKDSKFDRTLMFTIPPIDSQNCSEELKKRTQLEQSHPEEFDYLKETTLLIALRQARNNLSKGFSLLTFPESKTEILRFSLPIDPTTPDRSGLITHNNMMTYYPQTTFRTIDLVSAKDAKDFYLISAGSLEILTFKEGRVSTPDEKTELTGQSLDEVLAGKIKAGQEAAFRNSQGKMESLQDLIHRLEGEIKALVKQKETLSLRQEIYTDWVKQISSPLPTEFKAQLLQVQSPSEERIVFRVKRKYQDITQESRDRSDKVQAKYKEAISALDSTIKEKTECLKRLRELAALNKAPESTRPSALVSGSITRSDPKQSTQEVQSLRAEGP